MSKVPEFKDYESEKVGALSKLEVFDLSGSLFVDLIFCQFLHK